MAKPPTDTPGATTTTYRNKRAWVSLVLGVLFVGAGLGMMLDGGLGVSPVDVFFSGIATTTGLTVGTIVIASYVIMVGATYPIGIKPRIGTLFCVLLIGPALDAQRVIDNALGVAHWPVAATTAWWFLGMLVFTSGVIGLFAANLGVSPYDQVTQAVAKLTRRTLGVSRFIVDGTFLLGGFLLGGSWGIGTLILLGVLPVSLNHVLPTVKNYVQAQRP